MADYVPFIIFLMILAVLLQAESALTVFYLVIGIFILGLWWNKRAIQLVEIKRGYDKRAYLGDTIDVKLTINNKSILPILWLEVKESLPVNLRAGQTVNTVLSLASKDKKEINYKCKALKRGYYILGPLQAQTGEPLGLIKPEQREFPGDSITIYPQIVNLEEFGLPSRSPFGTIKEKNPIFEDTSRTMGKRDYHHGDSIRRIDWKSTASTGELQVKLFESAIALEIAILLDLNRESYNIKTFFDATELAVTSAASIAAWGKNHQQPVGLSTNGIDPHMDNKIPPVIPPKKGNGNFINILETLARIQPANDIPLDMLLSENLVNLPWGATVVLISGTINENHLDQLYQSKKRGTNPVILLTDRVPLKFDLKSLANHYAIPVYSLRYPKDLKVMVTKKS
ncbi:MAG: DUF58 domain-containing protein [Brevefilum sp.]